MDDMDTTALSVAAWVVCTAVFLFVVGFLEMGSIFEQLVVAGVMGAGVVLLARELLLPGGALGAD